MLARLERLGIPDDPIAFYGSFSLRTWNSIAEDLGSLNIVNLGFGGGTFRSGIRYLDQLPTPLKPSRIVLYFGENDIASDDLTAHTTFRNLTELRARLSQVLPQSDAFVLSIKDSPPWIYHQQSAEFNQLARDFDLCRSCNYLAFEPIFAVSPRTRTSLVFRYSQRALWFYWQLTSSYRSSP